MKEFLYAALPWIIAGLCVAVLAVKMSRKGCNRQDGESKGGAENYGTEGMCLGMCFGAALMTSFGNNTGIGLSIGMLIGFIIGSCIRKEGSGKDDER